MFCCFGAPPPRRQLGSVPQLDSVESADGLPKRADLRKPPIASNSDGPATPAQGSAVMASTAIRASPAHQVSTSLSRLEPLLELRKSRSIVDPGLISGSIGGTKLDPVNFTSSTFDLLSLSTELSELIRPEDLRILQPARRVFEVCCSPASMVRDVSGLSYISRGASSVVFHGVWQSAEVAVKFLVSNFSASSAPMREALLGTELAHPHVVQCYAARCAQLDEEFIRQASETAPAPASSTANSNQAASGGTKQKGLWRSSFDSEDGFGPPPDLEHVVGSTLRPSSYNAAASFSDPAASPEAKQRPRPASFNSSRSHQLVRIGSINSHQAGQPAVSHPNIWVDGGNWALILQALNAQPGQYLTMIIAEYCDLGSLSGAIHAKQLFVQRPGDPGRLAVRALLRTVREVAMGLHHLHQASVIHGDLKPANVVLSGSRVDRRGFVAKLTDLGLSRVLSAGISRQGDSSDASGNSGGVVSDADWGTTAYMAPEHFNAKMTKASDVYSLGVMIWEMAHGKKPFAGMRHSDIVTGVTTGSLQLAWDPVVSDVVRKLGEQCIARDPAARPTCEDVITQLVTSEAAIREEIRMERLGCSPNHPNAPSRPGSGNSPHTSASNARSRPGSGQHAPVAPQLLLRQQLQAQAQQLAQQAAAQQQAAAAGGQGLAPQQMTPQQLMQQQAAMMRQRLLQQQQQQQQAAAGGSAGHLQQAAAQQRAQQLQMQLLQAATARQQHLQQQQQQGQRPGSLPVTLQQRASTTPLPPAGVLDLGARPVGSAPVHLPNAGPP